METQLQAEKVREKAFHLCKEFLQGRWKEVEQDELSIRQISGGLSNLVFYVGLPEDLEPSCREPTQILLRLFGDLGSGSAYTDRLVSETVVFTMLAERNLGPKLYGVFPGGRLEEFIPSQPLTTADIRCPKYGDQIAKQLALIHSLDVPVSKEPTWLGDTMRTLCSKLHPVVPDRMAKGEREAGLAISKVNLRSEIDWLLGFLRNVPSPVVFSHNDINCGNVLAREDDLAWDPVVLIDFEFAAYNYRGFDLANHFREWMYDYGTKTFPYFVKDESMYPSRQQMERWLKKYLSTWEEQQKLQEENNPTLHFNNSHSSSKDEMDEIINEIRAFDLASHLLWIVWSISQAQNSSITFSYYNYAYDRLKDYYREKEEVVELWKGKLRAKRKTENEGGAARKISNGIH